MNKTIKGQKQNNKRSFKQFTLNDRIKIEIRNRDGRSLREITKELDGSRTADFVSREIAGKARKGLGKYQAHIAHEKALGKRHGKKGFGLKNVLI